MLKKISNQVLHNRGILLAFLFSLAFLVAPHYSFASQDLSVQLGWPIPSLGGILTFVIRLFFAIAGLAALFYLLLGALAWVTSGGSKDQVEAAQKKIMAAVIGVVLIVVVLSIIVTLEQVVFQCRICFGLSCNVTIPSILDPANSNVNKQTC